MSNLTFDQSLSVAEDLLGRRADRIEPFHPTIGGNDSHHQSKFSYSGNFEQNSDLGVNRAMYVYLQFSSRGGY